MKNSSLFFILYVLLFSSSIYFNECLKIDVLLYKSISEQLTIEQLAKWVKLNDLFSWADYLLFPIFLYIKITIITFLIDTAIFIIGLSVTYKKLFRIVILSEFVFLLPNIIKFLVFYFSKSKFTLEEYQYYMPLSLGSLFGYENFDLWYIYPLQQANLFEFIYVLCLMFLISKTLNIKKTLSLVIVLGSYGFGLTIWIVFITFLSLYLN